MDDSKKTKNQLIEELQALRARVAELEEERPTRLGCEPLTPQVEERYRRLLEHAPIILFSAEAITNRFLLFEGAVEEILGYSAARFYADPEFASSIVVPADRESLLSDYERGLAGSVPFEIEHRVRHGKGGHEVYVHVWVVPVLGADGQLLRQDGVIIDITERKRAEKELGEHRDQLEKLVNARTAELATSNESLQLEVAEHEKAEASLRLLSSVVEQSSEGIAVSDLDGNLLFANEAFAVMHGYKADEVIGQHLSIFHTPDQLPAVEQANRQLRETGGFSGEIWHVRRDGTTFPTLMQNSLLYDEMGKPVGMIGTMRDITEQKRAEEVLREEMQRSKLIIDTALDGFYLVDAEGRIHGVNPVACDILGYSAEELGGKLIADIEAAETPAEVAEHIERVRSAGRDRFETKQRRKDGRIIDVEVSARSALIGDRPVFFSFVRDITARKQRELRLARFGQAIENAGEGIGIWEEGGTLEYANVAMAGISGAPDVSRLLGAGWESLFGRGGRQIADRVLESIRESGLWSGRLEVHREDGARVPVLATFASLDRSAGAFPVIANIRDVTAEESHLAQIRKLSSDRARVLENERTRISKELHDELGQLLTALAMSLRWLQKQPALSGSGLKARLDDSCAVTERLMGVVRDLTMSLRPPIIEYGGLPEALETLVADFQRTSGVNCCLVDKLSGRRVGSSVATAVYRTAQEALTNVARHAQACECIMELRKVDDVLVLTITDDGQGSPPEMLEGKHSLGIVGMRERALALGGELRVELGPQGGVCVTASLPLKDETGDEDQER